MAVFFSFDSSSPPSRNQVAKVYISVYGDEKGQKVAIDGLIKLQGYVRKLVGQRVRLRRTPEIRFIYDDSYERAGQVDTHMGLDFFFFCQTSASF